ncbi:hypothetical protein TNIN_126411 [Trichonephila inaurata madagascariensis]|uniref:Uncharacterized protein n=1 Tax=Trichonephila inaurata madagascariensis TaxID=2747483 RepID=A0A8X7CQG7_9ARAC|nr:hypothetical protein TNIN_126411 [Trichonephila inaurata madagascariensis]
MINHRRRQDVVATFPNAPRHERRLECRATTLFPGDGTVSYLDGKKLRTSTAAPLQDVVVSFRCKRGWGRCTRPHFGFSAFSLGAFSTSSDTAPIYGKTIPNYD